MLECFKCFEHPERPWHLLTLLLFQLSLLLQISMNRYFGTAGIDFVEDEFQESLFWKDELGSAGDVFNIGKHTSVTVH
jgi:hypothetical protein